MFKSLILSLAVAAASGVSFVGSPKKAASDDTLVLPESWSISGVADTYIKFEGYEAFTVADGATEFIPNTSTTVNVDWGYDNSEPFINITFSNIGTENFSVRVDGFVDYQYIRRQNVNGGFTVNVWGQDAVSFVEDERDFSGAWLQITATEYPTDQFYGAYSGGFTHSVNFIDYDHRLVGKSYTQSGELINSDNRWSYYFSVKPNTTYTRNNFGVDGGFIAFDDNGNYLRWFNTDTTFTTASDTYYLGCSAPNSSTTPMFVEGSSLPSSYVPYNASWSLESPYTNFYTPAYYDYYQREYVGTRYFEDNYFIARFAYIEFKGFNSQQEMYDFIDDINLALGNATTSNMSFEGNSEADYELGFVIEDEAQSATFSFFIGPEEYTLSKSFVNCFVSSTPSALPTTFTASSYLNYRCVFTAYSNGYGFNEESITYTGGITIRSIDLFDEYGTSGYYSGLSFYVSLPLSDCSLTVEAFMPSGYSFSSQLNNCTVSPGFPSSVSGGFIQDYTFTANDGYGFHEDDISWEVENMFIDKVSFSSLLSGNGERGYFYSKVTLRLRFTGGGNVFVKVTASPFDLDSYDRGYEDGEEDGYRDGYYKGHKDGEIAGDSYGVWNWLKQAALTTGEFLNIPLLPGFSIGALLTALAGLMIIWLFIKGFLFKS